MASYNFQNKSKSLEKASNDLLWSGVTYHSRHDLPVLPLTSPSSCNYLTEHVLSHLHVLAWSRSPSEFFCNILWKNPNELLSQLNISMSCCFCVERPSSSLLFLTFKVKYNSTEKLPFSVKLSLITSYHSYLFTCTFVILN